MIKMEELRPVIDGLTTADNLADVLASVQALDKYDETVDKEALTREVEERKDKEWRDKVWDKLFNPGGGSSSDVVVEDKTEDNSFESLFKEET